MSSKKKVIASYIYQGCGFPVTITDAPMREIFGEWVLDIDPRRIDRHVAFLIAKQMAPLTGKQVTFVRKFAKMSLRAFGERLGVSHVAVFKWEAMGNKRAGMDLNAERVIRAFLFLGLGLSYEQAGRIIMELNVKSLAKKEAIKFEAASLAA
jgi:DNA-binding transcriptional regulator YiaG